jgi:predicted acylesterase/phospholipase RssA
MSETQPGAADPNDTFRRVPATSQCDLIMKGGITSGVVYPPAILKLAEKFRFHSIGGASAGAIAAAATAAAEYGRDEGGGFATLGKMKDDLAKPGFLLSLFQPTPATRPLFEGLLFLKGWWAQRPGKKSLLNQVLALRRAWREKKMQDVFDNCPEEGCHVGRERGVAVAALLVLLCLLPWALVAMLLVPSFWVQVVTVVLFVALTLTLFWAGAVMGGVVQPLLHGVRSVTSADSLFSICTGFATKGSTGESLTAWMHTYMQKMAGLPLSAQEVEPLTVGHLRRRGIDFKAVTTDLTQGQPIALPMDERRETRSYVFNAEELRRLFPGDVVEWMVKKSLPHEQLQLPAGFHIFPTGEDLPVIVAMRMSLSFPVLLSALRLYIVPGTVFAERRKAKAKTKDLPLTALTVADLEPHWFSDGGIASNFPIHLFDSWMPVRPTFGINLRDSPLPLRHGASPEAMPSEEGKNALQQEEDVVLVRPRDFSKAHAPPTRIESFPQFLGAMFETAQNFRDNSQAALPGYRERIAHVYLEDGQGGLNLSMEEGVVGKIAAKGEKVAQYFMDPKKFSFREHQWVRMLTLMSLLERELGRICEIRGATDPGFEALSQDFRELLEAQKAAYGNEDEKWYRPVDPDKNSLWFTQAEERMKALTLLMKAWAESQQRWEASRGAPRESAKRKAPFFFFQEKSPYPAGILRVTPEL